MKVHRILCLKTSLLRLSRVQHVKLEVADTGTVQGDRQVS